MENDSDCKIKEKPHQSTKPYLYFCLNSDGDIPSWRLKHLNYASDDFLLFYRSQCQN